LSWKHRHACYFAVSARLSNFCHGLATLWLKNGASMKKCRSFDNEEQMMKEKLEAVLKESK